LDNFLGGYRQIDLRDRASLCQFFRILTLGTVALVITFGVWAYAVTAFLIMPFVLFGGVTIATFFGTIVLGLATIVAIVYFIAEVMPNWVESIQKRMRSGIHNFMHQDVKNPGFGRVWINYLVAVKNKFCPMIHFTKDDNNE
jgi:hypothetical protein